MSNDVGTQAQTDKELTAADLVRRFRKSPKQFGDLLYQICEISGFTQGKLSREAKEECRRLMEQGILEPDDPVGSMEQPTISKVMAGTQGPTYLQVLIWLRVIKAHFQSAQFAEICEDLGIEPKPKFDPDWEKWLWHLAFFPLPDEHLQESLEETEEQPQLFKIYDPLIVHKEERWNRARSSVGKSHRRGYQKKGAKILSKDETAAASARNDRQADGHREGSKLLRPQSVSL